MSGRGVPVRRAAPVCSPGEGEDVGTAVLMWGHRGPQERRVTLENARIRLLGPWPGWGEDTHTAELSLENGSTRDVLVRLCEASAEASSTPEADAEQLSRLRSPYVLRLLEILPVAEGTIEVFEPFSGVAVDKVLGVLRARGRLLPVRAAVELAYEVSRGLAAVQDLSNEEDARVAHPGPVPGMVLVDGEGRVKLSGFCVVRPQQPLPPLPQGYRSPGETTEAGDVSYALGALIVELLSGERPSAGSMEPSRHEASVRRALIRVLARAGDAAPEAVVQLVRRCLAREPSDRPGLDEVSEALGRLVDRLKSARLRTWAQGAVPGILEALLIEQPMIEELDTQQVEPPLYPPVVAPAQVMDDPTALPPTAALQPPARPGSEDVELGGLPVGMAPVRAERPPVGHVDTGSQMPPLTEIQTESESGDLTEVVGIFPESPTDEDWEAAPTMALDADAVDHLHRAGSRGEDPGSAGSTTAAQGISDVRSALSASITGSVDEAPLPVMGDEGEPEYTEPVSVSIDPMSQATPAEVGVAIGGDDDWYPEDEPLPPAGGRVSMPVVLGGFGLLAIALVVVAVGLGMLGSNQLTGQGVAGAGGSGAVVPGANDEPGGGASQLVHDEPPDTPAERGEEPDEPGIDAPPVDVAPTPDPAPATTPEPPSESPSGSATSAASHATSATPVATPVAPAASTDPDPVTEVAPDPDPEPEPEPEIVARIVPTATPEPAEAAVEVPETEAEATGARAAEPDSATASGTSAAAEPAATSSSPSAFRIEFRSENPDVVGLEVRCHRGSGSGTDSVVIPDAGPGPCKVTGRTSDTRLIAMVTATEERVFTCFADGTRTCR